MSSRPISELLREVGYEAVSYAKGLENSGYLAKELLGRGKESIAVELDDGNVMKIGTIISDDKGERPFDIPILGTGHFSVRRCGSDFEIGYIIQPKAETNGITIEELKIFKKYVRYLGYVFDDFGTRQVGRYQGRIVLLDYSAVKKKTDFI